MPPYDFRRPRLRGLTRALAPAYLRISGTAANKTFCDLSGAPMAAAPVPFQRVLTRSEWDGVNAFATRLGLQVDLGINAGPGPRDASGRWTADNAGALLDYTARMRRSAATIVPSDLTPSWIEGITGTARARDRPAPSGP